MRESSLTKVATCGLGIVPLRYQSNYRLCSKDVFRSNNEKAKGGGKATGRTRDNNP